MPHESTLGVTIKRARQRKRMTQAELAGEIGVDRATVADWERDHHYPSRYAGLLEQLLDISIPAPETAATP